MNLQHEWLYGTQSLHVGILPGPRSSNLIRISGHGLHEIFEGAHLLPNTCSSADQKLLGEVVF